MFRASERLPHQPVDESFAGAVEASAVVLAKDARTCVLTISAFPTLDREAGELARFLISPFEHFAREQDFQDEVVGHRHRKSGGIRIDATNTLILFEFEHARLPKRLRHATIAAGPCRGKTAPQSVAGTFAARIRSRLAQFLGTGFVSIPGYAKIAAPSICRACIGTGFEMISQRAKYALRALVALARAEADRPTMIMELSNSCSIPKKFLEQILLDLKHHDLVRSKRGKFGGYLLNREPSQIMFGEVLRIVDGPIALLPCLSKISYRRCADCLDEATCEIRRVFAQVANASRDILDNTSLSDAMNANDAVGQGTPKKRVRRDSSASSKEAPKSTVQVRSRS